MTTVVLWAILWLPSMAGYQVFSGNLIQTDFTDTGTNLDSLIDTSAVGQDLILDQNISKNSTHGNILQAPRKSRFDNLPTSKIRNPWPTGALFLSAAIPGGGQFYNGKYIKSFLYGVTEIYLIKYVYWRWKQMDEHWQNFKSIDDDLLESGQIAPSVMPSSTNISFFHTDYDFIKAQQFALYEKKRDSRNTHIWLTALVVFVSMFDAYVDAHLADFNQTDKAFDAYIAPEDDKVQLNLVYRF